VTRSSRSSFTQQTGGAFDGDVEATPQIRVLYGADAARFLAHIRELLERPAALAL